MTDITVVTITRGRPESLLNRAVRSVREQEFRGNVEHLVIIDDCQPTLQLAEKCLTGPGMRYIYMPRSAHDANGPRRLAWLRNFSAYQVRSEWMAFLDDDNEFEPCHLQSLHEAATKETFDAVFSYDHIFNADGTPFLQHYWPWARTPEEALSLYDFYCTVGVLTRGSNLQRHLIQTEPGQPRVLWVDTNVWLFKRDVLRRLPISTEYDDSDWRNIITEDDKMLANFVESGIKIGRTLKPTVRYYLGGYSNRFDTAGGNAEIWHLEEPNSK